MCGCSFYRLCGCLVYRMCGCLVYRMCGCSVYRLRGCLVYRLCGCPAYTGVASQKLIPFDLNNFGHFEISLYLIAHPSVR